MANTDITLRLDKGSSLTFNEMDTNFASFFYSASTHIVGGANKLRLFYTGSGQLDAPYNTQRFTEVSLPSATTTSGGGTTDPAGSNRQIQFNDNGSFGASAQLQFLQSNSTGARLGVGLTPRTTLDIQSANSNQPTILNLNASSNTSTTSAKAMISFRQGGATFAQLGKRNQGNNIVDFYVKSQLNLGTHNYASGQTGDPIISKRKLKVVSDGIIVGDSLADYITVPLSAPLNVIGQIGVGSDISVCNTNFIGGNTVGSSYLPTDSVSNGLLIQSPKSTAGGHVVIGINTKTSGTAESFSIVKGSCGTFNGSVATFKADGKVGIGCVNPTKILDVNGDTKINGNINVSCNATVDEKVTIGCIPELASLSTDWSNSSDEYTKTLVTTDSGLVQYMDAAPIPKGGIIMWAGSLSNIPTGWRLCEGGSAVNGVSIPDLRERFVVGSGGVNSAANTSVGGSGYATGATGGDHTCKLGLTNIPQMTSCTNSTLRCTASSTMGYSNNSAATLCTKLTRVSETWNDSGTSSVPQVVKKFTGCAEANTPSKTDTSNAGGFHLDMRHKHSVTIGTQNNSPIDLRPPYYALAFIIYVGVA